MAKKLTAVLDSQAHVDTIFLARKAGKIPVHVWRQFERAMTDPAHLTDKVAIIHFNDYEAVTEYA